MRTRKPADRLQKVETPIISQGLPDYLRVLQVMDYLAIVYTTCQDLHCLLEVHTESECKSPAQIAYCGWYFILLNVVECGSNYTKHVELLCSDMCHSSVFFGSPHVSKLQVIFENIDEQVF